MFWYFGTFGTLCKIFTSLSTPFSLPSHNPLSCLGLSADRQISPKPEYVQVVFLCITKLSHAERCITIFTDKRPLFQREHVSPNINIYLLNNFLYCAISHLDDVDALVHSVSLHT